ncbi:MAG: hypothetical protein ABL908_16355 [Hyphomicrobium sp.]
MIELLRNLAAASTDVPASSEGREFLPIVGRVIDFAIVVTPRPSIGTDPVRVE